MDKKEFSEGIRKIENAYSTKFNATKLSEWYRQLNGMNYKQYITRIEDLISIKKYIPNVAEILDTKKGFDGYEQRQYSTEFFEEIERQAVEGGTNEYINTNN